MNSWGAAKRRFGLVLTALAVTTFSFGQGTATAAPKLLQAAPTGAGAMPALGSGAPYVRRKLGFALSLRHTPELHCVRDLVEEQGARVDELLQQIEHERVSEGKVE